MSLTWVVVALSWGPSGRRHVAGGGPPDCRSAFGAAVDRREPLMSRFHTHAWIPRASRRPPYDARRWRGRPVGRGPAGPPLRRPPCRPISSSWTPTSPTPGVPRATTGLPCSPTTLHPRVVRPRSPESSTTSRQREPLIRQRSPADTPRTTSVSRAPTQPTSPTDGSTSPATRRTRRRSRTPSRPRTSGPTVATRGLSRTSSSTSELTARPSTVLRTSASGSPSRRSRRGPAVTSRGVHVNGDTLVLSEFTNGGAVPGVQVWQWAEECRRTLERARAPRT